MSHLKRVLFDEYEGFPDRRIKDLTKASKFIVDTRKEGGLASDGKPFGWFCEVYADVRSETEVEVSLQGSIPMGDQVQAWLSTNGLAIREKYPKGLFFLVTSANVIMLDGFADAVMSIVAPGAPRYQTASYKYSCPRTAESLKRLKATLERAWADGQGQSNHAFSG